MSIEIKNLRKEFQGREVLKGISYTFEKGQISMIIGASGSGKSVTLKCIVGLLVPDGGEILFDGVDFHKADFRQQKEIRQNIGMLFQGSALFDSLTVAENVAFPIKMFTKWGNAEVQKRVDSCLERVNLQQAAKLLPSEISGGMKKRVGIARAIALNPKYLFVDEPNSGLDPLSSSVIDKLIQEITREFDMTTIVVSHDMNSVMNIGEAIMFVYKGGKEWEGSNKTILNPHNKNLEEFIFVSDLIKREADTTEEQGTQEKTKLSPDLSKEKK